LQLAAAIAAVFDPSLFVDQSGSPSCVPIESTPVAIGEALGADEYALALPATSASHTSWAAQGNEALILEIAGQSGLIGHLVLHQGADGFVYTMQLGVLKAGEVITARVSELSAPAASPSACVGPATLTPAAQLGAAAEGLRAAPIIKWPTQKRFDDLPVVLGWSRTLKHYELYYTNEDGGTVALCGGSASGMQAEIARWGRGCDVEAIYNYGGASPGWERCTGVTRYNARKPRHEGLHPIFYYGDGHNRLFEDRGGYGAACGTLRDARANGDLEGWNAHNPGNAAELDGPFTLTLRPLPVELDPLGFPSAYGRREAVLDRYAPWLYRLTDSELVREGKIDGTKTLPLDRYLFVDVHAFDVNGSGDGVCSWGTQGGFVLRVQTAHGSTLNGPQMTADYFGKGLDWKRLAIPLDRAYAPSELTGFVFDAYDNDGIYFLDFGDAFMVRPSGDNGATLEYVHRDSRPVNVYVDDDNSGCVSGVAARGPGEAPIPCAGGEYRFSP
jgi:hypothetical protein